MFVTRKVIFFLLTCSVVALSSSYALAQSSSSSYRIDESFIGPGGALESSSGSYSIDPGQQAVGSPGGVGESESTSHKVQSGNPTTSDPRLSCSVNSGTLNFGALSNSVTVTATAQFSVLNYTAYGYSVTMLGNPPSNGAHTLTGLSSNSASIIGQEQFGINLKDNATPNVGADPVQVPSGSFSFGVAATNYDTADSFRYVSGESIANAPESSGQTDYTISYIINTAVTTPGGAYAGNQVLLCTGTY